MSELIKTTAFIRIEDTIGRRFEGDTRTLIMHLIHGVYIEGYADGVAEKDCPDVDSYEETVVEFEPLTT